MKVIEIIGALLITAGLAICAYLITVVLYCSPNNFFNANCVNVFHPLIATGWASLILSVSGLLLIINE